MIRDLARLEEEGSHPQIPSVKTRVRLKSMTTANPDMRIAVVDSDSGRISPRELRNLKEV